tara:strand:+ start:7348 stop:7713 length:366 start_codon:yes stop_codon:yes gene_type:complete
MSRATINRIAVFSILLVIVFVSARRIYLNSQDQLYTVGQINRIISPSKGGLSAIFSYEIDNQEYSGTVKIYKYEDVAVSGAKFIVSVPKGYSAAGIMLLDLPVPDGIEAPQDGWKKKPAFD